MISTLTSVLDGLAADYVELRFHRRRSSRMRVADGSFEDATSSIIAGVGIRALVQGAWGFSGTGGLTRRDIATAAGDAVKAARGAAAAKADKVECLAPVEPVEGVFEPRVRGPLDDHPLEEKVQLVKEIERLTRTSKGIRTASVLYREFQDHKVIVTSEGTAVEVRDSKPEFYVSAVAGSGADMVSNTQAVGITGGWEDLFHRRDPEEMARTAVDLSTRLLAAKHPKGERATVILDPSLVGLISHEAFGHLVEASFVLSGSVVRGKIGERVASDLVTLVDEGTPAADPHAAGTLLVDDEGVPTRRTAVVERGILRSYLHDRETAQKFGVPPTGNARAWEYRDEPMIRMRNTYIEAGDWTLEEILEDTKEGYLLKGAGGGQADANGEFMFTVEEAYPVAGGETGELLRGATIGGSAFQVLGSVDAISREFRFDMGSGFCMNYQPAKVDGGGGHIRCEAIIGGRQG
jgi:TldD protein